MKKMVFILLATLCLILPSTVKAALSTNAYCDKITTDEQRKLIKKCYIDIKVTGETTLYKVSGKLVLTNTTLKGNITAGDQRITLTNSDLSNLTFVSETPIKNETVRIATYTIYQATNGEECITEWGPGDYGMNYSCVYQNGFYYDKNGNSVSQDEYNKQCVTPEKHVCQIVSGSYFGKNGTQVTDVQYDKECNNHYCKIIDGTYFGKNGNEISKANYDIECPAPNPHTASGLTIWHIILVLLSSILVSIYSYIKHNKKVYKI